ncbi:MAG: hypothetical protein HPKKFMNG_03181 [Planctomycetes bacterium]|nr:hypothetical protein [Planctomycetota bacterium]
MGVLLARLENPLHQVIGAVLLAHAGEIGCPGVSLFVLEQQAVLVLARPRRVHCGFAVRRQVLADGVRHGFLALAHDIEVRFVRVAAHAAAGLEQVFAATFGLFVADLHAVAVAAAGRCHDAALIGPFGGLPDIGGDELQGVHVLAVEHVVAPVIEHGLAGLIVLLVTEGTVEEVRHFGAGSEALGVADPSGEPALVLQLDGKLGQVGPDVLVFGVQLA